MVKITYKVQLKPTKEQLDYFHKASGTARYSYNWAKNYSDKYYEENKKTISEAEFRKMFTIHRNELEWLKEVSNDIPKQAIS